MLARLRRAGLTLLAFLSLAAPAQALIPDDPGSAGVPAGWQQDQWNFLPGTGVNAPLAWDNLIRAGRPGGLGVTGVGPIRANERTAVTAKTTAATMAVPRRTRVMVPRVTLPPCAAPVSRSWPSCCSRRPPRR